MRRSAGGVCLGDDKNASALFDEPFKLIGTPVPSPPLEMGQSRSRSFVKAVSWRAIATCTGVAIVIAITGEFEHGALFAGADISLKMLFYYLHERGWEMVTWGRMTGAV